jgi:multiple sugar transport system substrate-binding protein
VYANGQKLFDFDLKEAYFSTHNVEFAIKYAIEMNRLNLTNVSSSFEQGRAVMKVTNFAQAMYYIHKYPHLDLEIFPFPKGPDGNFTSEPYDTPLAINTKSKHKDLAMDFMTFLVLDYDNQVSIFKDSFSFPVLQDAQNSEEIRSELEQYVNDEVLHNIINSKTISIDFHQYYQLMNIADKEIFQYVKYELDIASELEALNEIIANELKAIG